MIAVIQRVSGASVEVEATKVAQIQRGILCFLGIEKGDTNQRAEKLMHKVVELRIFADAEGKMNLSLSDIGGELLIVSQFTLAGDCKKGKRPSFDRAEAPEQAKKIYEHALSFSKSKGMNVQAGVFQADMKVNIENDGPVTFILEMKD